MVTSVPTEPGAEPEDATLVELIEQYQRHLLLFTSLRISAASTVVPQHAVAEHALAALALMSAAISDLSAERLRVADDALRCGIEPAAINAVRSLATGGEDRS